jgi:hypothetical protein
MDQPSENKINHENTKQGKHEKGMNFRVFVMKNLMAFGLSEISSFLFKEIIKLIPFADQMVASRTEKIIWKRVSSTYSTGSTAS